MAILTHRRLLGQVTTAAAAGPALAQTGRPTRILVGFAAGGGNDVIARIVTQKLSDGPFAPVLVENRAGASGLIAADILAKAPPDGTTLMVASQTTSAVAPGLYKSATFDARRDVAGVALLGASPLVLIANPSFAARSLGELIDMAKARRGVQLRLGRRRHDALHGGGAFPVQHRPAHDPRFLPRRGAGDRRPAGRPGAADVRQRRGRHGAGEGWRLAGARRYLAQAGTEPARHSHPRPVGHHWHRVETWFGLTAPAATPRDVVRRLNAEVLRALAVPDLKQRLAELGLSVTPTSPEELDALIKSEAVRWADVIRKAGIRSIE